MAPVKDTSIKERASDRARERERETEKGGQAKTKLPEINF